MKRDDYVSENVGSLAMQGLNNDPAWYTALFTFLSGSGMVAAGLVDVALNYSVMSAGMADPVTGKTEAGAALWFGSAVMLIAYWGIGVLYAKSFVLRRFAFAGYFGMVLVLIALLMPVQGPRFSEMWASISGASPFGGSATPDMPYALLIAMVALTAVLYTGPGLFFVWCKGRFVFWVEKCRNRSVAGKVVALSEQADALNEEAHAKTGVIDHFTDPMQQAATVRAIVNEALNVYVEAVEVRERKAKLVLASVEASKTRKQEAEGDLLAADGCKNAVALLNV